MREVRFIVELSLSLLLVGVSLSLRNARASAVNVKLSGSVRATDGTGLAADLQVISGTHYAQVHSYRSDGQGRFSIEVPAERRLLVVAKADG